MIVNDRILIFCLVGLIILIIAITLGMDAIRKKDFKDPLSGKKPLVAPLV